MSLDHRTFQTGTSEKNPQAKILKVPISNVHWSKLPFLTIISKNYCKNVAILNGALATNPQISPKVPKPDVMRY